MTYFRDWFSRDADYGYTYYDPSKRAYSWDKGYTNYSDFFLGGSKKINMEEAASLLSVMSKVMGVSRKEFAGNANSVDRAFIPTKLLNDTNIDVFIGASLQNIASLVHLDRDERLRIKNSKARSSLKSFVFNVLNQERINTRMAQHTPGYLKFIKKYKDHKYETRPVASNDYEHLLDLFDRIIRYPDQITEEELSKFQIPIDKIKSQILKYNGIPDDIEDCDKLSKKISNIISEFVTEQEKSKSEKSGSADSDSDEDGDGDGDGSCDEESKTDEDTSDKKTSLSKSVKDSMSDFAKKLMGEMEESDKKQDGSFAIFMKELDEKDEIDVKVSGSKIDYLNVADSEHSANKYNRLLNEIDLTKANVIANLLQRKNRDYQFALKSMRSGRLDTNKLAEAKQHVSTIYERIGQVKTDKLSVTILVDESGSMHGYKIEQARKAAIYLNECLKKVKDVELFIYGHTADWGGEIDYERKYNTGGTGSTQIQIYKEPGSPQKTALADISAKYENRDGSAIIAAAKRVRSKTQNNGLFIVISDGSPCANKYTGVYAIDHTRRMVNEVEKMGFQVIQIAIDGYRSKDMFKNVIHMNDMSKFPAQFVEFLRTKINTLITEKVIL